MLVGASTGIMGATGLFAVAFLFSQLWGNRDRRTLVKFLKAIGKIAYPIRSRDDKDCRCSANDIASIR